MDSIKIFERLEHIRGYYTTLLSCPADGGRTLKKSGGKLLLQARTMKVGILSTVVLMNYKGRWLDILEMALTSHAANNINTHISSCHYSA